MKKEYLIFIRFQKIENHVTTFPYLFWFDNNVLNV